MVTCNQIFQLSNTIKKLSRVTDSLGLVLEYVPQTSFITGSVIHINIQVILDILSPHKIRVILEPRLKCLCKFYQQNVMNWTAYVLDLESHIYICKCALQPHSVMYS